MIVDCYNCGSSRHTFYCRENGFDMVRCSGCGLLYVRDRPDDAAIDTATAIGQHHGEKTLNVDVHYNPIIKRTYVGVLRDFFGDDFSGMNSWLDVGCGHGEFMEAIKESSGGKVEVFGSEPNRSKQQSARSRGLDVGFFDIAKHERRYDVVSLLNVYSHLANPKSFLGELRRLIKPGGFLLIQTGDAAGFTAEDMLKPLSLPDHLSFASEKIVTDILTGHGLRIVKVNKYPTLRLSADQVVKEFVKFFLPGYHSYLKYYLNWKKYAKTNMYVLAAAPRN